MAAFVTDLMVIYACPWTANKTKVSKCAVERVRQQTEKIKEERAKISCPQDRLKPFPVPGGRRDVIFIEFPLLPEIPFNDNGLYLKLIYFQFCADL